jgi:hypothetical protein
LRIHYLIQYTSNKAVNELIVVTILLTLTIIS